MDSLRSVAEDEWPVDPALSFPCSLDPSQEDYLVGNAHTFPGRILAFCERKEGSRYYNVSASSVLQDCSEAVRRWVQGFLAGSEPKPPRDQSGDVFEYVHPQMVAWRAKARTWAATGIWPEDE